MRAATFHWWNGRRSPLPLTVFQDNQSCEVKILSPEYIYSWWTKKRLFYIWVGGWTIHLTHALVNLDHLPKWGRTWKHVWNHRLVFCESLCFHSQFIPIHFMRDVHSCTKNAIGIDIWLFTPPNIQFQCPGVREAQCIWYMIIYGYMHFIHSKNIWAANGLKFKHVFIYGKLMILLKWGTEETKVIYLRFPISWRLDESNEPSDWTSVKLSFFWCWWKKSCKSWDTFQTTCTQWDILAISSHLSDFWTINNEFLVGGYMSSCHHVSIMGI